MKQLRVSKTVILVLLIISISVVLGATRYLAKNNLLKNIGPQPTLMPKPSMSNQERESGEKTNKFKFDKIKTGDIVVGMVIKFIKPFSKELLTPTENDVTIGFSGKITVSGEYHYYGDDPSGFLSNTVCFDNLDEQSQTKIPKMIGDDRNIWFCFSNQELARNLFNPQGASGMATIVIDDYVINILPAEVTNTAKLIKIISKN